MTPLPRFPQGRGLACLGAVLAGLLGCLPPAPAGAPASSGARPRGSAPLREDRVLVGSYLAIEALAVSRRFVFAAAMGPGGRVAGADAVGGILVYDRVRGAWLPPVEVGDGVMTGGVRVMAADPSDDALWIGTPGQLRIFRPITDQWVQVPITGIPDVIAFARPGGSPALGPPGAGTWGMGDAWVRASGQWMRVSRVGMVFTADRPPALSALLLPPTSAALAAQFPALRTLAGGIPLARRGDRPLRSAPVRAIAMAPERAGEAWVGSGGDGVWQVDAFSGAPIARPYGLLAPGAGALAPALGGLWVGGVGFPSARAGLTYASDDLQQWRWIDGTIAVPLEGVRVLALATRGPVAWMGTDRGLVRAALDGDEAMRRWTVLDGLPDERVVAVAPRPEGSWAATLRGLVFVHDSTAVPDRRTRGIGARWLTGQPVWALQPVGDTLWMGTEGGLVALAPAAPGAQGAALSLALGMPGGVDRRPVRALAATDSILVAATDEQVVWRQAPARASGAAWQPIEIDLRLVGRVQRVAADAHSVFVAGSEGVVQWQRRTGAVRRLSIPADLPAPALDLVPVDGWLWVATPAGLVRLRRDADGALSP
jgi:ligand-binding sensor domain-containing protein